jgi:hypothetical protein
MPVADSTQRFGRYRIESDEIVFAFNASTYAKALSLYGSASADFYDLNILQASQGNYKKWSKDGWRMQRIKPDHFEIRKKITEIEGTPNWFLRLLSHSQALNEMAIREPSALLKSNRSYEHAQGNAEFFLAGNQHKKQVILTGTFNDWNEQQYQMRKTAAGWSFKLQLPPGHYEYKFIADGEWLNDPANPEAIGNEHGTLNSILAIKVPVLFTLKGFTEAREVQIGGEFNDWTRSKAIYLERTPEGWQTTLHLLPGKHMYKYMIDGVWTLDPNNKRTEETHDGYLNSVKIVKVEQ